MIPAWPLVLDDDPGIRPAGQSDECFYCKAKVGKQHGRECVIVSRLVEYDVLYEDVAVGTYRCNEPYCWSEYQGEFHKNESSWCASNAVDVICWADSAIAAKVRAEIESRDEDNCCCDLLAFRLSKVVDEGPLLSRGER